MSQMSISWQLAAETAWAFGKSMDADIRRLSREISAFSSSIDILLVTFSGHHDLMKTLNGSDSGQVVSRSVS